MKLYWWVTGGLVGYWWVRCVKPIAADAISTKPPSRSIWTDFDPTVRNPSKSPTSPPVSQVVAGCAQGFATISTLNRYLILALVIGALVLCAIASAWTGRPPDSPATRRLIRELSRHTEDQWPDNPNDDNRDRQPNPDTTTKPGP